MFELVPSTDMRDFYKEIGFEFTDFQKATLIWNAPDKARQEILDALQELADETAETKVRQQILERITYEKKAFAIFLDNSDSKFVYVVEDREDRCSCGFYQKYDMAVNYAVRYSKEYETKCSIKKQRIVMEEADEIVRNSFRENPNMGGGDFESPEYCAYSGDEVASAILNEKGEVVRFWSLELPEEEKTVDEYRTDRFEFAFMKEPFAMPPGTVVKNIVTGNYGVLAQGKEDWDAYMKRIEERNLYVDFSDIQVIVYELTEKGYWSHEHTNPMHIEADLPSAEAEDGKVQAFRRAAEALGNYFRTKSKGENLNPFEESVLKYAREYAAVCKEEDRWGKIVEKAEKPEDILW